MNLLLFLLYLVDLYWETQLNMNNLSFSLTYQDENRYNAVRGAHKNLKRAEKARILVSKIQCESFFYFKFYICISFSWSRILMIMVDIYNFMLRETSELAAAYAWIRMQLRW